MKKYVFKPYSKSFPELFDKEKARIKPHLKKALAIEHIGSTAIPGLGGKGIIDIVIAADREDLDFLSQQIQNLGYEFQPIYSTPDRFFFVIYLPDPDEDTRAYHIHLTHREGDDWKQLIGFRDYLIANPEEACEYEALKKQAVLQANDVGEVYRRLKDPMFKKINALINKSNKIK